MIIVICCTFLTISQVWIIWSLMYNETPYLWEFEDKLVASIFCNILFITSVKMNRGRGIPPANMQVWRVFVILGYWEENINKIWFIQDSYILATNKYKTIVDCDIYFKDKGNPRIKIYEKYQGQSNALRPFYVK